MGAQERGVMLDRFGILGFPGRGSGVGSRPHALRNHAGLLAPCPGRRRICKHSVAPYAPQSQHSHMGMICLVMNQELDPDECIIFPPPQRVAGSVRAAASSRVAAAAAPAAARSLQTSWSQFSVPSHRETANALPPSTSQPAHPSHLARHSPGSLPEPQAVGTHARARRVQKLASGMVCP